MRSLVFPHGTDRQTAVTSVVLCPGVASFGVVLLELITGRPPIMEDPAVENESYMVTLSRWVSGQS